MPVSERDTDVPHLDEKKSGVTGAGEDMDTMILRRGLGDDDEKRSTPTFRP